MKPHQTRLIIARHGNTFSPGEPLRRVGARTDLPLVASGEVQARRLGEHLRERDLVPDVVFSSALQRARRTAELALEAAGLALPIIVDEGFNEIDHGPDEGRLEEEVVARVGEGALAAWNEHAVVPPGWLVEPEGVREMWQRFGARCVQDFAGKTVLVVTSNGVARFALGLIGEIGEVSRAVGGGKLRTGAFGVMVGEFGEGEEFAWGRWMVEGWGVV